MTLREFLGERGVRMDAAGLLAGLDGSTKGRVLLAEALYAIWRTRRAFFSHPAILPTLQGGAMEGDTNRSRGAEVPIGGNRLPASHRRDGGLVISRPAVPKPIVVLPLRNLVEQVPDQRRLHRHVRIVQQAVQLIELPGIIVGARTLHLSRSS